MHSGQFSLDDMHAFGQSSNFHPYTIPFKIKHPVHNIHVYWTNFWQQTVHEQQNIFENTLIEDCSPHLYASFGTFYVQIYQLFATQLVF